MSLSADSLKPSLWWHELAVMAEGEAAGPAADATALSLLALLAFCTVCFVGGALVLRRREMNATPDDSEEEQPEPSMGRERPESSKNRKTEEERPKREPWERGADWWKESE